MRRRRLGLVVVAVVFLAYLGWDLGSGISANRAPGAPLSDEPVSTAPVDPSPPGDPSPATHPVIERGEQVAYSVDIDEVAGLAPTATPGTRIELWVTWDRPLVRQPELRSVVRDAMLERIDAPLTPEGPTVATFLVSRKRLEYLMWADRYGDISAVTLRD